MKKPLISIIVPVYRVEAYIRRCVESLTGQSYSNIEIILVDDGSPDGCPAICDEYALYDKRIRVIHKENGGLSDARNAALDIIRGEYLTFVDSDDFVSPQYIGSLYNALERHGAQMSVCGMQMLYKDAEYREKPAGRRSISMDAKAALETMLYQRMFDTSACAKLYLSGLFTGLRFKTGIIYEDMELIYKLINRCRHVAYTDAALYAYRQRRSGIIYSAFSKDKMILPSITKEICAFIGTHYPDIMKAAVCRHVSGCFHIYLQMPESGFNDERLYIESEIKAHRSALLTDAGARLKTRLACAVSFLGMELVKRIWRMAGNRM